MKKAKPTDHIDVHALRVGMFVHLDIGWMAHPFPLSSFRITTPAQLATIRTLGLRKVRWSPQQSDLTQQDASARAMNTLPGPLPIAGDAANDSGLDDADAVDTVPYALPVDDNVVSAAARAIRHGSRGQARPGAADNFAIPVCPVLSGTP